MESYGLDQGDIYNLIALNNRVVACRLADTGYGRFSVKVPSVFDLDKRCLRAASESGWQSKLSHSAILQQYDAHSETQARFRLDGKSAIVLDVKKASGRETSR